MIRSHSRPTKLETGSEASQSVHYQALQVILIRRVKNSDFNPMKFENH